MKQDNVKRIRVQGSSFSTGYPALSIVVTRPRTMIPAVWYALLVVPAVMIGTLLYPKVPLYVFRVRGFPWTKLRGGELHSTLQADVRMQNENYLKTDIHALAFDLYFPSFDGEMHRIGHVQDRAHYKASLDYPPHHPMMTATPEKPMWTILPRSAFETQDELHLRIPPSQLMKSMGHLLWQALKGWGSLQIPTTGVIHVKASNSAKVTISIMCENTLNVITMAMEGNKCVMNRLATGWISLGDEVERLRSVQLASPSFNLENDKSKELTLVVQKAMHQEQLNAIFLV